MDVGSVFEVVKHNRLRWFRHVERKSNDWVNKSQQLMVEGKAGRGRGSKTWQGSARRDMKELSI